MSSSRAKTASKPKQFYVLAKPGIIYANVITAIAGYLFVSLLNIDVGILAGLVVGLALVIGGACAYNNYLDQGIDKKMKRTQKRGLVDGSITGAQALVFATGLTLVGLALLAVTQNLVTCLLAVVALVAYVILYGLAKRKTVHGTLIGCISGSIPLVAGYTAATGRIDLTAGLLFMLMVAWQMAHFYGIGLLRLTDYSRANLPIMPVVYGARSTQIQIVFYIILFMVCAIAMTVTTSLSAIAGGLIAVLGGVWLYRAIQTYGNLEPKMWGKNVFIVSLKVMLGMSALLTLNPLLSKIA